MRGSHLATGMGISPFDELLSLYRSMWMAHSSLVNNIDHKGGNRFSRCLEMLNVTDPDAMVKADEWPCALCLVH